MKPTRYPQSRARIGPYIGILHQVQGLGKIKGHLGQVRQILHNQLGQITGSRGLEPLVLQTLAARGKMIRPAMVILSGMACGRVTSAHIRAAAIMEMIHQATLLHDDVVDQAKTRRGLPTVNRVWGNTVAVLLGDMVLAHAMAGCVRLGDRATAIVTKMAGTVCRGELLQVLGRGRWQMDQHQYLALIKDKSASFFAACCQLGATLCGAQTQMVRALANYGLCLGMAFQIRDDILDLSAGARSSDKSVCRDPRTQTVTLPVIRMLQVLAPAQRRAWLARLGSGNYGPAQLRRTLRHHGCLEYAQAQANQFLLRALGHLELLGRSAAREGLTALARYCAGHDP